tara:strand:+ start:16097 stop:16957 length:861 start_codon:yes stop_codon:yes gene_type:complete
MTYALRNTIILLITLFLFVGAAIGYVKFFQLGKISDLSSQLVSKEADYAAKQKIRNDYPALLDKYLLAKDIVLGYDKTLYPANNPDDVYNYLSQISGEGLELFYDFILVDSVKSDQYGIINSDIQGMGVYSDIVTFVNTLENSTLLNKIEKLSITPLNNDDNKEYVSFNFRLKSYYQRVSFENGINMDDSLQQNPNISVYNPFKPIIMSNIPLNEDNQIEIERSRLLGISGTRVFLIDQFGNTRTLKIGDKVFLGYLKSINTSKREVVFDLDKGGIKELFTLKVER